MPGLAVTQKDKKYSTLSSKLELKGLVKTETAFSTRSTLHLRRLNISFQCIEEFNLIKDKLIDLIERTFQREGSPYLACSDRNAFFTSEKPKKYHAWSCQNVCDALTFLLDHIFIRFGSKLYRQVVGIPMGTNCAPLVADLFLFCYERDFMMSLSDDKQADIIDAFNTTSRYLDDILNINNVYFENMVSQIYPSELKLNKANASDTDAAF